MAEIIVPTKIPWRQPLISNTLSRITDLGGVAYAAASADPDDQVTFQVDAEDESIMDIYNIILDTINECKHE